jgi:hypothetical protein
MDIQGIKLVTGEELVAKISRITDDFLVVDDALVLLIQQDPKGLTCNFFPWTIIAEGSIYINRDTVVANYPVPQEVQDSYLQNTIGLQIVSVPPTRILNG